MTASPDPRYIYVALVTLVAAVIAGVLPALHATGKRMQTTLKEFGSSSGLRLGGTWTTLIVVQVALAVAGLPIAVASFWSEITYAATTTTFESAAFLSARLSGDTEPPPGVDPDTYRRDTATSDGQAERRSRDPPRSGTRGGRRDRGAGHSRR